MRLLYATVGLCFMALASVVVAGDLAYLVVNASGAPDAKGDTAASRLMVVCIEVEQKDQLTVFDFASSTRTNIPISSIRRREAWTEQAVITRYGLTSYAAYRIERALQSGVPGKIGKLTADGIYVVFKDEHKLQVGNRLSVLRTAESIKDPDSGEVVANLTRKIGVLEVVRVEPRFVVARWVGDTSAELLVGDTVQSSEASPNVAVLPFACMSGASTNTGPALVEDLTTGLARSGIAVVERSRLQQVVGELTLETNGDFNTVSVQKAGKLAGATFVVTGAVRPSDGKTDQLQIDIRLIQTETGKVLCAVAARIPGNKYRSTADGAKRDVVTGPTNLLASLDLKRDVVWGVWQMADGALTSDTGQCSRLEFPYELPAEYDYKVVLSRRNGNDCAYILGYAARRQFIWAIGAGGNTVAGFPMEGRNNPSNKPFSLTNGKQYTCVLKVRRDSIQGFVNGKLVSQLKADFQKLEWPDFMKLKHDYTVGLGSYCSSVEFYSADITPVSPGE